MHGGVYSGDCCLLFLCQICVIDLNVMSQISNKAYLSPSSKRRQRHVVGIPLVTCEPCAVSMYQNGVFPPSAKVAVTR
jgi:hypothetical protein